MRNLIVADLMNRTPVTAKPDDTLFECAKKIVRKRVDSLVIVENGNFAGFISQKDILWAVIKKSDISKIKAKDVSPKKIITLKPSETLEDAIKKINKYRFYRLPVVQNGKVEGVINLKDILKIHPEVFSQLKEIGGIREELEELHKIDYDFADRKVEVHDGICGECGKRAELYKEDGVLMCFSCLNSV